MDKKKLDNKEAREERKEERKEKRAERKTKRKSKTKKELDISIDTKRVDIDIDRDAEGNVEVEWDGKHVDGKYSKSKDGKVTLQVEINDKDTYLFEANGTNRRLPKGLLLKLSGAVIKTFLNRKWGKLKKK